MDKDHVDGIGNRVSGSFKDAVGNVTADTKLEAEGTAHKTAGAAPNGVGGVKDGVRDAAKK